MAEPLVQHVVIDRIEGDRAVIEGLGSLHRSLLPTQTNEGDVLTLEIGNDYAIFRRDVQETERRRKEALERPTSSPSEPHEFEL